MGSKKLAKLLSTEEKPLNHKRINRIMTEQNLRLIKKKRRRVRQTEISRIPAPLNVTELNELWSIDFMCTRKVNAFKFMLLNVVDVGTRMVPVMKVERSFTSLDVTDELEKAILLKGKPKRIITDNGAEFTSAHFKLWCLRNEIVHHITNKGSPAENCFVESFNSCVRREVLDENDFLTMNSLRKKLESWRIFYNEVRPHGSLDYKSPEAYYKETNTLEVAV